MPDQSQSGAIMPQDELPELVRLDALRFGRRLARQFSGLRNNPKLVRAVCRIVTEQICPRKRAGRPPRPEITKAEELLKRLGKEFDGPAEELWERVCLEAVPGWAHLKPQQKVRERRKLKNQVSARRAARRKWKRVRRQRKESERKLFSKKKSAPVFLAPQPG